MSVKYFVLTSLRHGVFDDLKDAFSMIKADLGELTEASKTRMARMLEPNPFCNYKMKEYHQTSFSFWSAKAEHRIILKCPPGTEHDSEFRARLWVTA